MEHEQHRALDGLTVLEWGNGRAAAYAGKLLRDFGGTVTLLEPPGTQREAAYPVAPGPAAAMRAEALTRFLHGGKRSVALDLSAATDRRVLDALLDDSDVFILEQPSRLFDELDLSPERLTMRHPRLVVVPISLGGLRPSGRSLRHSDLVAHAVGGIAYGTPTRVSDPETYPPLRPGGHQADYTSGLAAASGALLGVQHRRRTGRGQVVDVSTQAVIATFMRMDIAYRTYDAPETVNISGSTRQSPTGRPSTIWGLVPCKDGYFAFQASEQYQWQGLMKTMGDPEWAQDPRFQEPFDRINRWDEIEPHFIAWTLKHRKSEIFHAAQANHVPVFPCYRVDELLDDAQQIARGFFVSMPLSPGPSAPLFIRVPGAVLYMERTPWQHDFEPPRPGEHTERARSNYENRYSV